MRECRQRTQGVGGGVDGLLERRTAPRVLCDIARMIKEVLILILGFFLDKEEQKYKILHKTQVQMWILQNEEMARRRGAILREMDHQRATYSVGGRLGAYLLHAVLLEVVLTCGEEGERNDSKGAAISRAR